MLNIYSTLTVVDRFAVEPEEQERLLRQKQTQMGQSKGSNATLYVLVLLVVLGGVAFMNRGHIYDILIVHMTKQWYALVLSQIPENAKVLDVGVGTAAALLHNGNTILSKQQHWVGIDYDLQYIDHARLLLAAQPLALQRIVDLYHVSVYDFPAQPITHPDDLDR